jgi:hypothetical protein
MPQPGLPAGSCCSNPACMPVAACRSVRTTTGCKGWACCWVGKRTKRGAGASAEPAASACGLAAAWRQATLDSQPLPNICCCCPGGSCCCSSATGCCCGRGWSGASWDGRSRRTWVAAGRHMVTGYHCVKEHRWRTSCWYSIKLRLPTRCSPSMHGAISKCFAHLALPAAA